MKSLVPKKAALIALAAAFFLPNAFSQVNILTNRYNQARTAANINETQLTQANVNTTSFGKLGVYSVDGVIYAQPLYVQNVTVNGASHNVLYVATMHDVLYAFDADSVGGLPLWTLDFRNLAAGITPAPVTVGIGDGSNAGIADTFGILSTPVIDLPNNRLFLVTHTMENGAECFRLRDVDIRTGALLNSTLITGSVPAVGSAPGVAFNPPIYGQRAALEIADGQVWVAFTSRPPGDSATLGAWYGWVMTYNPNTLAQTGVFATSRTNGNSIWQSGSGPAVDANGNVYFLTGNGGTYDGITEFPETLLQMKYAAGLTLNNWYTPDYANGDNYYVYLNQYDLDVSVDGPVLIPGTDLITFGGKTGDMWVLHTGNLGQLTPNDTQVSQFFHVGTSYNFPTFYGDRIVGNVYWQGPNGGNLYVWPGLDTLHVYTLNTATSIFSPSFTGTVNLPGSPGTALALSANGSNTGTGILWAPTPIGGNGTGQPGVLHAYNAENPAQELWNSKMVSSDSMGTLAKFTPPVVANGKVYIANSAVNGDYGAGSVTVYGLKPATASNYVNPYVSLVSPANATTFVSGSTITFSANAYPGSSPVASVSFLDGPNLLATITTPPYTYSWTSAPIGSHTVNAVATDTMGVITLANAQTITVTGTPTYSLSASPDSVALPPGGKATIAITVTPLNGFSGPACEEIAGLPSGISSSVTPAAATRGGPICATSNTFNVTLTAASSAAQGTWKVAFITGANGTVQNTLFLPVTVSQAALVPGNNTLTLNVPNGATLGTPVVFSEAVPSSSLAAPDFSLVSTGTTCTGAATGTCTVNVQFKPQFPGLRRGAVNLVDTNNNVLATSYFYGTGPGSLAPLLPGSQTTLYQAGSPRGVAVDAAGNVFLVDNASSQVFKVSPGGTPVAVPLGATLNSPFGLALDAAGNLYIADAGNNRILELSYGSSTATALNITGLTFPEGVAVDGTGNLFIANTKGVATSGNGTVIRLAAGSGVQTTLVSGGLNYPSGVALDAAGDVFVADWGDNRVLEIPVSGPPVSLGSNLSLASAVAVDALGDVFIADENHNQLVELPATASGPGTGTQTALATGLIKPYGLALDGRGDVFVATVGNSSNVGSVVEIPTILTQTITFPPIPTQTANTAANLVASASSGLPVTLTSSTPAVCTVSGATAALLIAGTCTITASQAGSSTYLAAASVSQSFTVTAEAQAITFSAIPTQNLGTALTLSATASSALPVLFTSLTPAVCTVSSNTATFIVSGACTIVASQSGNSAFLAATPVAQSFTVVGSGETISISFSVPSGVTLGTPVVFTEGVPSNSLSSPDFTLLPALSTCTAATGTCSVRLKFTPQQAGLRRGAVKLVDSNNNVLATSFVSGIGPGSLPAWAPGVAKTLYNAGYPRGLTLNGAGDVFFVDSGSNALFKIPAGGKATAVALGVTLNSPFAVALDAAGDLFIADAGNNRVLELPYNSSTAAPVNVTGLNFPEGVAVDGSGNLFIANTRGAATSGNGTIVELAASGAQSVVIGGGLSYPAAVALDSAGDIFVADWGNNRVLEQSVAGGSASIGTGLANASAVAVDASGDVFIADQNHNQVVEVPGTATGPGTGVQTTVATGLLIPYGLAVDGQGDLFVANVGAGHTLGSVQEIPRAIGLTFTVPSGVTLGTPLVFTEGVPSSALASPDFTLLPAQNTCTAAAAATCSLAVQFTPQFAGLRRGAVKLVDHNNNVLATQFVSGIGPNTLPAWAPAATKTIYAPTKGFPRGITVDGAGNAYILDSYSNQIFKIAPGGSSTAVSLGLTLNSPFGLALDAAGNLYVADAGNNRILELPYGGSTATALNLTGLNFPEGLAVDGAGNLFIANTRAPAASGNGNILKLAANGTQTTILGSGLSYPSGVALDAMGDIFVADWGNNRVLQIPVNGPPSSIGGNLAYASAVAVDAAGDVFIADQNNNRIVELPATASGPGTGTQTTVATGLVKPYALALDEQGDIFAANVGAGSTSGNAVEILRVGAHLPQAQTITFSPLSSQTAGSSLTLSATASSGLPVSFASATPNVCTVSGATATLLYTGLCSIVASQSGSAQYLAAPPVTRNFAVMGPGQTVVTFAVPAGVTLGTPVVFTEGVPSASLASPDFTLASTTCPGAATAACTVTVQFTPQFAGLRRGAVKLLDKNNNVLATSYISGIGASPQTWTTATPVSLYLHGAPRGVAVDGAGDVFFVDSSASQVYVIKPAGTPSALSLGTTLNSPYGLALDGAGNLYIADAGNNRVLELPYGGGTATAIAASGLAAPHALAVDGAGNLFIANSHGVAVSGAGTIVEIAAGSGAQTTLFGSGLAYPSGIALDAVGNVYIADWGNNRVLEVSPNGTATAIGSNLSYAAGVAVDAAGDVFIADELHNQVVEVPATGTQVTVATGLPTPYALTLDGHGNLFVASVGNSSSAGSVVKIP